MGPADDSHAAAPDPRLRPYSLTIRRSHPTLQEARPLSRVRFAFALVAIALLATALAACGGGGGNSNESPQTVLKEATVKGINSGNVELKVHIDAKGEKGGTVDVSLDGPFESQAGQELPELDMTVKAKGSINGEDVDFEGGLVLLPNSAYVNYKGTEYEVDPTTFSFVKSMIEQVAKKQGGKQSQAESNACKEAAEGIEVGDFIENLKNEGSSDVGGTSTTKVSGDLNVSGAIDVLTKLIEDPACSAQLGSAGPFPSKAELDAAKGEIESSLKESHVEEEVGEDNIVRRVAVQVTVEPQKSSGEGPKSVEVDADLSLTGVNEEQSIEAPQGAKPLNELFEKLGINPLELLNGLEGAGGSEGLGNLLESLGGAGGGSSGGGSSGGGSQGAGPGGGATGQQAYLNCVQAAKTPSDLQRCAELLQ
jgi:hypothetical protein